MSSREQNERRFHRWQELASGGRSNELDVPGRHGWSASYFKEVDAAGDTVRFWQEIYDEHNVLVEIHEKYPVDRGHVKIERG